MKRYLVMLAAPAFLAGCPSTTLCNVQKNAADKFASTIGTSFACTKVDAIAADLNKALEPLKLCEAQSSEGVVADLVCPPMVKFALSQGVSALPTSWECTGGPAADVLESKLTELCKTIPF